MLQERQRGVAQEGNVVVVTEREQVERVGDERGEEGGRGECQHDEVLQHVEQHEEREVRVAVNVQRVQPLHALFHRVRVTAALHAQIFICHPPVTCYQCHVVYFAYT